MVTYLIGLGVKTIFAAAVLLLKTLFGDLWTSAIESITTFLNFSGVQLGLKFYDLFVGVSYTMWAIGTLITIILTVKLIRLIIGIFSKG
jgi:hypothetical protein